MSIDKRAIIDPAARLADNVTIGPYAIVGPRVEIGEGTVIDAHVVIKSHTKIGKHNRIYQFASIGDDPQQIGYQGEESYLEIGDHNVIREFVTINRGIAEDEGGITSVGNYNYLMAYSHIAHNCRIGNRIVFANNATIAGHVVVDDYAILSGFTAVHQFCYIGAYSFLRGTSAVSRDVMPYLMVNGRPTEPCGLNTVGLRRNGFSSEVITQLKEGYRVLFRKGLKLAEAREELVKMSEPCPRLKLWVEAIDRSKRSIARPEVNNTADTEDSIVLK